MDDTFKGLLRNQQDFNRFRNSLYCSCYHISENEPEKYPCVVVQWNGEDCSPYSEFEFVYLEDFVEDLYNPPSYFKF